ncbi:MAG: right-handed parallel beta-helix repeat-containing protein [Phycisphaerales bacterium]
MDQAATGANNGESWADAYTDLQDALEDAEGDPNITEIWVAQGVYVPSVEYFTQEGDPTHWHKTFRLIDAVKIYGGFVGVEALLTERDPENNITTLSGDLGDPAPPCEQGGDCFEANGTPGCDDDNCCDAVCALDPSCCIVAWDGQCAGFAAGLCSPVNNAFHVVTADEVGPDTALNGFTVTGGRADLDEGENFGGGMWVVASNPKVVRCTFTDNLAGGGAAIARQDTVGGQMVVVNCSFTSNTARFKGGAVDGDEIVIVNCVFSGNVAQSEGGGGGGGAIFGGDLILTNCSFEGNAAQGDGLGGGILLHLGTTSTLTNCILWGNTTVSLGDTVEDEQISLGCPPGTVTVTYTCIEGLVSGGQFNNLINVFNIGLDPEFVDEISGNLRLLAFSPCIDTADNDAIPDDVGDLDDDGNTGEETPYDLDLLDRTQDSSADCVETVDMGAYEFQPCLWDLDNDCSVGASDLLALLAAWGTDPGAPPDFDCDSNVGASDLLTLLANWGLCPCGTGAEPPSLQDELDDACLSGAHWDDFLDKMETGSSAEQANYICWLTHYFEDCTRCICIGASGCPGADPFN